MNAQDTKKDYADEEVKGLERYVPTRLAKGLLVSLFLAPIATFQLVRSNPTWFALVGKPEIELTLWSLVASLLVALAISLLLALETTHVLASHKHRRIVHYTAQHPNLTPTFLWHNTRASTNLFTVAILSLLVILGYVAAGA
jgi:hypothetical protein